MSEQSGLFRHRPSLGSIPRFGGSPSSTTTTQTTQPWSGEQQPLNNIYNASTWLYQNGVTPQYYPSDTYAPMTGEQTGLMNNLIGATQGGGDAALQGANSALSGILGGEYTNQTQPTFGSANSTINNELQSSYLSPQNSPTYESAVSNALASALPAANASFVSGNRSDSGLAAAASSSAATNAAAGLAQQQYDVNQNIQNQAAQLASQNELTNQQQQVMGSFYSPFVDQQQTSDMNTALNTAGLAQENAQNQINANVAAWNYGQMLPWNELGLYEGAVTGTGVPGTMSSASQPYYTNTAANVASGLGSAAAIGSLLALL